jgi:hypothetical protein
VASLRRARPPRAGAYAGGAACRVVGGQYIALRGALTPFLSTRSPMHDWPYESLIGKLKAALAEVETNPDPSPSDRCLDADGQEASAVVHADTLPAMKQT